MGDEILHEKERERVIQERESGEEQSKKEKERERERVKRRERERGEEKRMIKRKSNYIGNHLFLECYYETIISSELPLYDR